MLDPLEDTPRLLDLRAEVEGWERTALGDPLAADHRGELRNYLDGLREVAGRHEDPVERVLIAVLGLGPRDRALPGTGDLRALVQTAVETDVDAIELAVAWGSGWGRLVAPGHDWHGRWVAALLALSCLIVPSIRRTVRRLEDRVPRLALRDWGDRDRSERFGSYARHVAMELSFDACSCGHGGRAAGAGGRCGRPEHRLASWRPEECRLQAFIATAVRGSSRGELQAGAFAVSMLAPLLREDEVVRVDVAEFQVCHACNPGFAPAAKRGERTDLSGVAAGLHEFPRCPVCGALARPGRTYRVARKNWLLVPDVWGGEYEAINRHRCACCGNLFAAGDGRCPLCRHPVPAGARRTGVWVRRVGIAARRPSVRGEAGGS